MSDMVPSTPNAAIATIKRLIGNKDVRGIIWAMLLKVGSAVVAFALFSLAARSAGAEEFGRFSILFSALFVLSVVAVAGQEMQVVRSWSEYLAEKSPGLALGALQYGWFVTIGGAAIIALILAVIVGFEPSALADIIDNSGYLIVAALAFLVFNTFTLYSAHAARAIVGINAGDANYEITWRAIAVIYLIACMSVGHAVTTTEILAVFAVGLFLVVFSQVYLVVRNVKKEVGDAKAEYRLREWTPRSVRLWLAAVMESSNQYMEVFLIGLLLDPIAAGAYFVVVRLANAFALAAGGLHTFGTRRVPDLYFSRKVDELKQTLDMMAGMSLIIVVIGLAAVAAVGNYMLMIFGETYAQYHWVFLMLAVGTGINAANGPSPSFLMFTGYEGRYVTIVTTAVVIRIVGFFLIIPHFGIYGAAAVSSGVMIAMSMVINYTCRKFTGMDPSILRFFVSSKDKPPPETQAPDLIPEGN
ncbi:polysaccharide biosynthesis C-terminal domain-containing protein [uncultured Cohaesibacter sp.]|uniref:lipopolysaccharide biosynthesis protein n=1 Tax=uncultured Cohaesibacter sp. TaxID=1002546 RepID=UPI00292DC2EB|nr:polysaccharide biosynthesis C-terminal domain-containing protein [uncultured Cohaesibacter sp.]